jgi:hypothetical protein
MVSRAFIVWLLKLKVNIIIFCNNLGIISHQMAPTILNEEIEHEQDIEDWLTDI